MVRRLGCKPAWIRVLLVAIPGLLAVSGCESILEQLPGVLGDDDTHARAIPITAGVYRSGRLETRDDVDYFKVVVRASAAVIAATDRGRAADSDNNVRDTVVRIEHGRSGRFAPLEVDAHHVDGALVTVGDSGPANVYIRVSSDVATPYDLAVWVIDRQALPWFFGDVAYDPSFDIALRYVGAEPSAAQKAIIRQATDVWERVITDGGPDRFIDSSSVTCDDGDPSLFGAHIDDLVVYIKVRAIDGQGGTLAQAGPCWTRLPSRLPYLGIVILDSADLTALHNAGVLRRIVTHEIGHALGFGTSWDQMAGPHGLRQPSLAPDGAKVPGRDTYFSGRAAVAAFNAAGGHAYRGGEKVPVENDTGHYGAGTLDAHWRESVFDAELMTSSQLMQRGTNEPLSLVTVAALDDMGYTVDDDDAEPYTLPVSARAAARRSAHAEADVFDLVGDVRQAPVMTEDPLAVPRVRLSR